jgi:predicted DNA-binding WGR domain protein
MRHVRSTSPSQLVLPLPVAGLRRIDPTRNMARFYSMDVERDLFGRVVLVRRWGRIGTAGRTRLDEHPNEGRALAALAAIERQKRRRGYRA